MERAYGRYRSRGVQTLIKLMNEWFIRGIKFGQIAPLEYDLIEPDLFPEFLENDGLYFVYLTPGELYHEGFTSKDEARKRRDGILLSRLVKHWVDKDRRPWAWRPNG